MIRVAKADLHLRNHQGISAAETILPSSPLYHLVADNDRAISDPKKLSECLCKRVQEHHVNSFHILMLLRQGADINFKDQTQSNLTPLMLAVIARNDTMVDYLLDQGADPLVAVNGLIASDYANRRSPSYPLLKKREKKIRLESLPPQEKYSLLLQTYVEKPTAKLQKINHYLTLGADVNYQNSEGATALMLTLDAQNERLADYLLTNGANPLLKNKTGHTARDFVVRQSAFFASLKGYELLWAVTTDNVALADSLLRADPTIIDFPGKKGYTALLMATAQGKREMVEYLLMQGANRASVGDDGLTLAELAQDNALQALISHDSAEDNLPDEVDDSTEDKPYFFNANHEEDTEAFSVTTNSAPSTSTYYSPH